jgi:hypothetical protein
MSCAGCVSVGRVDTHEGLTRLDASKWCTGLKTHTKLVLWQMLQPTCNTGADPAGSPLPPPAGTAASAAICLSWLISSL